MTTPAPPLEWHPYYRDKTWLLDWLEGRTKHDPHHVVILVPQRMRFDLSDDLDPSMPSRRELVMTRRKVMGQAPYVGRPFVYMWWVGVDNLGRQIAGEARIVYNDPAYDFIYGH